VFATVVGRDSVGLLALVLRRFETFRLRPRRFALRTEGDRVSDWFWLEPAVVAETVAGLREPGEAATP